jgi:AmmeMemoRadiSam system protein B
MRREATAAGLFYPADARKLARTVTTLLESAGRPPVAGLCGLIAPHAGYEYSGPVAASAFALLPPTARIVVLGPSHFVPLDGMAVSTADTWATPLGDVSVAADLRQAAIDAGATADDLPHEGEHAIEVELPFLQRACSEGLEILPVAVGRTEPAHVAALISALDALAIVSTDLSHYHDHATATRLDRETADAIVGRDPAAIGLDRACGVYALRGLVEHARRDHLRLDLLDLRTSADTSGEARRVVGYGAFAVSASSPAAGAVVGPFSPGAGVGVMGTASLRMSSAQSFSFA